MEATCAAASRSRLKTIVCETQNTNVPAIHAYRKLGFRIEGIDVSLYRNVESSDECAIFMKKHLVLP